MLRNDNNDCLKCVSTPQQEPVEANRNKAYEGCAHRQLPLSSNAFFGLLAQPLNSPTVSHWLGYLTSYSARIFVPNFALTSQWVLGGDVPLLYEYVPRANICSPVRHAKQCFW